MLRHNRWRLVALLLTLLISFGSIGAALAEDHEPITIQLWTGSLITTGELLLSEEDWWLTQDRKSTRLNSSHTDSSRMPSSA